MLFIVSWRAPQCIVVTPSGPCQSRHSGHQCRAHALRDDQGKASAGYRGNLDRPSLQIFSPLGTWLRMYSSTDLPCICLSLFLVEFLVLAIGLYGPVREEPLLQDGSRSLRGESK